MANTIEDMYPGSRDDLIKWANVKIELKALKAKEMALRNSVAAHFINPDLGVNRLDIGDGFSVKLTTKNTTTIDVGQLDAMEVVMIDAGIPMDMLIVRKPTLSMAIFNKLNPAQRVIADQITIIKPAAVTVDVVPNVAA